MKTLNEIRIFSKDETDSTQNDASKLIESGEARHGDICTALYQNAGRGRIAGRAWEGEKDSALMFTLILEKKRIPLTPPLSLIIGLGEALFLEKQYSLTPRIKWPNDIYLRGKKCGGILCESRGSFWLCGMGINLNQTNFSGTLSEKAVSLHQILGYKMDREKILPLLTQEINLLMSKKAEDILRQIEARLLWKEEEKTLLMGDPSRREKLTGTIKGINPDGALLIEKDGNLIKIYSAEFLI
jgi:BirA family transcriptional regulator, biotin operon repressor / biotin---[acetyl-CoA-carboxylase] ligase